MDKKTLELRQMQYCMTRYKRMRAAGRAYQPQPATGHMPFEGHRNCREIKVVKTGRRPKRSDYGYGC